MRSLAADIFGALFWVWLAVYSTTVVVKFFMAGPWADEMQDMAMLGCAFNGAVSLKLRQGNRS